MEKSKKRFSVIDYIIIIIEIAMIIFLSFSRIFDKSTSIFGYSIYSIATPSMVPTLKVRDVIISKNYSDNMELKVNDIITYNGTIGSYNGKRVTHRIVKIEYDEEGSITYITTKGDNNEQEDPLITLDQVIGKMVYKTVIISFIIQITSHFLGFFLIVICPILYLLISTIIAYLKEIKIAKNEEENEVNENNEL